MRLSLAELLETGKGMARSRESRKIIMEGGRDAVNHREPTRVYLGGKTRPIAGLPAGIYRWHVIGRCADPFMLLIPYLVNPAIYGGADGTRTRNLRRDRPAL